MPLNLAVIGLGRWGPNHVRNFSALRGCRVVAGADPSEKSRAHLADANPAMRMVADYREILDDGAVDAVVVATPTGTHFEIVSAALAAGKHVLCEKPLTDRSTDAWSLVRAAAERGVQLMCGHVFLFNPGIEYLARALRDGSAGRPYYVNSVRTNLGPFRRDVNAAWDLASHDVYIFNHLLGGRPTHVSAAGASFLRQPVEDIVFITLRYAEGVIGHIHVSWLDPKKVRQITVVGEKKMITWDEFGTPGPVCIFDRCVEREPAYETFGEFQLLMREGDATLPRVEHREPLAAQAREFVARASGTSQDGRRGGGREAAEVVDVLEAVSRSLAAGGAQEEVNYGG